jgi:protein gp37
VNETEINWTDLTWNMASGCEPVSPGCKFCYAETLSEDKRGTPAFPNGFEFTPRPHKLKEPARVKAPSLIFTNSMTDMFLPQFTDAYRDDSFEVMERVDWHRYQVLTKRVDEAARYFSTRKVPASVWLGATVEMKLYKERIAQLRQIDARVRFLSCEPLLEDLDLSATELAGIHWVIGGGESGRHLAQPQWLEKRAMVRRGQKGERSYVPREDRLHWATKMRDVCAAAGVAFWWKQFGGATPKSGGRAVEGVEHDGMPTHVVDAMPPGRDGKDYVRRVDRQREERAQRLLPVVG